MGNENINLYQQFRNYGIYFVKYAMNLIPMIKMMTVIGIL